jgi:hypothetical protein
MKIQPEIRRHEIARTERRTERNSEDSRLTTLKARLKDKLNPQKPKLFAVRLTAT